MSQSQTSPNSKESEIKNAEMMVLGDMLVHPASVEIAVETLNESDFLYDDHQFLFSTIKNIRKTGGRTDLEAIIQHLNRSGNLGKVGGAEYLVHLQIYVGTSTYIEAYCEDVHKFSTERNLIDVAKEILSGAQRGVDPFVALERLSVQTEAIKSKKTNAGSLYRHLLELTTEAEIAKEIKNINPGARVRMTLGSVDLKIPGGALTILAGPTGHGKTLLTINMLLNYLSLHEDKKVWFLSYEESRPAILSLFLNTFINEKLSENNRESIKSYFRDGSPEYVFKEKREIFLKKKDEFFRKLIKTGRLNIFYCDYDIEELNGALRFLSKKSDVGLIAIDYVQLLRQFSSKTIPRHEELKQICQVAKDCAVATGLPILLPAQFNRTVVNEATMSKLAIGEAGDIERSANTIIGLWNRNENESSEAAKKGRNGKDVQKESAMYLEILKSREIGIGHSTVMALNGNTGKLTPLSSIKEDWSKSSKSTVLLDDD